MIKVFFDFISNNPIEILIIGTLAYFTVGQIMKSVDFSFGSRGGKILWLIIALLFSYIYHLLKEIALTLYNFVVNLF